MGSAYRAAFYSFIIWVPIPLGSNRPVFWAINAAIMVVIAALLLRDDATRASLTGPGRRRFNWLALALLVPIAWMVIQSLPWLPAMLQHPGWDALADAGIAAAGAISASPAATLTAAAQYATVALAGLVAYRIVAKPGRAKTVLWVVVAAAVAVAVYGMVAMNFGWKQNLTATSTGGDLTAFFVNRNTAATYFSLGLAAAVALMMAGLERVEGRGILRAVSEVPERAALPLLAVGILGVALLATSSRAGVLAGLAGVAVTFLLSFRRAAARVHLPVGLALLVGGAAIVLFGVSAEGLLDRLSGLDLGEESRWQLYRDTIDMIAARPLLGHGAGTFAEAFPAFHSDALPSSVVWLEAHNSYLQMAAELGVPMAVLVILGLGWGIGRCATRTLRRSRPMPAAVAAVGAGVAVSLHAAFDFSLQVQAVAVSFAVLLAAGLAESARRNRLEAEPVALQNGRSSYEVRSVQLALDG